MFHLPTFINCCREAASLSESEGIVAVHELMQSVFANPSAVLRDMPIIEENERLLYEDDTCQVWYCGFSSEVHVPPHDHQCYACVGVYEGVEINHMYQHDQSPSELKCKASLRLGVGDILQISPDDIHSVQSADAKKSKALHVYLGNLSKVNRHLFDWRTGDKVPFSEEKYNEYESREDRPEISE
jgi:predicted metal-dependent enzyme (double-stranded beta helix superfamily)